MATDLLVLVERCRQGDDLAWEQLVRRCQGRVYALAYHYLGRFEDARDVAQEVFVRVYQQLDSCHGYGFMAWLLRIARNHCIDQIRRWKARPRIAWEAGYVATLVVWLFFGASWSPLRATPAQALTLIQQGASDTLRSLSRDAGAMLRRLLFTNTDSGAPPNQRSTS